MSSCGASCGHNHDDHLPPPESNPAQSLHGYIDHEGVTCLNESVPGAGAAILRRYSDRLETEPLLESDVDEELLLFVPFTGLVQLHSIHIRSPATDEAPAVLKLYKNSPGLDFDSAADMTPVQKLEHPQHIGIGTQAENGIVEYALNRAKFSNVTSLAIYIPSNYGADETKLSYIGLSGSWQKLSKAPVGVLYESAANPADHKIKQEVLKEA